MDKSTVAQEVSKIIDEINSSTLAEAAALMGVDARRAEELAEQGLVRATQDPAGWRFDKMSVLAYVSDRLARGAVEQARQHSEDLAELIEQVARIEYTRGEVYGMADMGRRIAEELDAILEDLPEGGVAMDEVQEGTEIKVTWSVPAEMSGVGREVLFSAQGTFEGIENGQVFVRKDGGELDNFPQEAVVDVEVVP